MARIKGGMNAKKKHNRTLKLAKGYRGARSKQYRVAKQSVMRALTSAYAGRKERKRQMRQLWIARINAAARMNGLSYSKFMHGLKVAGVDMNRKMLAELSGKINEYIEASIEKKEEMQKFKAMIEQELKAMGARTDKSYKRAGRLLHRNPGTVSKKYGEALKQVQDMLKKRK